MTGWTKFWLFLALMAYCLAAPGWCAWWLLMALISYRTVR